ncbi:winged helix-turn-helix domain-containing protein [Lentzea sp. NBC_00516]|uniref:AfsR/SARP family transcriptional regulator n=1 Tax=Lentzea sp. NBC_00516 TaxID=2903582 RepID=UPI002E7FCAD9|nr:BTAD domain-containing putative transcriptional regulator [Lentzea sp. NBC_00516]WUD25131.1 winged helix-turn-helix domain-containing protein [Lentzea sp. NBC_00516]
MLRLLGEVSAGAVDLGPPRQRCVLAALAVDAGKVVPVERLVERVWGVDAAPRSRTTLHSYVSRLRRAVAGIGGLEIEHRSGGYVLTGDAVDLLRFHDLRARAREGDAIGRLSEALALWRAEALTGLDGEWVREERDRLEQERLAASNELVDARLATGEGGELVAELSARVSRHPLNERVAGQYLVALHRSGRSIDALEHYRQVRERLLAELGAEPSAALRELHQRILVADPRLTAVRTIPVVPRQLPSEPATFVGRRDELDRLDAVRTAAVSAIAGTGGIGKTSLALRWAHRHAGRFPDGQLFVDLRGFSPTEEPMTAGEALGGLLHALAVDPGRIPACTQDRSALFRSLVAGRRMVLVLDNAACTDQVVPLLPGNDECAVIITSRNRLPGLITRYAAQHLLLSELTEAEGRALLTDRLGAGRLEAEPFATDRLIAVCGGFPLALSIVAAHAQMRQGLPLATLAAELDEAVIDVLDNEEPSASLPAVLSWSLRALCPRLRDAFALLGIAPGPDIGLAAAVNLLGTTPAQARQVLRALEEASLLHQDVPGRWRMHDLVRAYATTVARDVPEPVRENASRRVLDHYVQAARVAEEVMDQICFPSPLDHVTGDVHLDPVPDDATAQAWFEAEFACLVAAQQSALDQRRYAVTWLLAWHLHTFMVRRGLTHARLTTWRLAAEAAGHLDDPAVLANTERMTGVAHISLGHHEIAVEHLHRALAMAEHCDDTVHLAGVHYSLGVAWGQQDPRQALTHARHALVLYRAVEEPRWEARALAQMGWHAAALGQLDAARGYSRLALARHRRHGFRTGEAAVLTCLGLIAHRRGHYEESARHYEESIAVVRELGHLLGLADGLERLGHTLVALGRHSCAEAVWREALGIYLHRGMKAETERVHHLLTR